MLNLVRPLISRTFHQSSQKLLPAITVTTNVKDEKIPHDFEIKLTRLLAESMEKPIERMGIIVHAGARYIHGGVKDPAVLISVRSIGKVTGEDNIRHTERATKLCNEMLNIPSGKVTIEYYNLSPEMIGHSGTTVANSEEK